jgi:DNA (cytosine-5)-methyltransferase 1
VGRASQPVADAERPGLAEWSSQRGDDEPQQPSPQRGGGQLADADGSGWDEWSGVFGGGRIEPENSGWWAAEPDVGRVAARVPSRVDRLRCLGNAVVPQVAEWVGRRILEAANDPAA